MNKAPTKSDEVQSILRTLETKRIDHREYRKASEELFTHATFAPPGTVIMLVGPSRAGKSRVVKGVFSRLMAKSPEAGKKPAIWCEAVNSDRGRFSCKELTQRMLVALEHPLFPSSELDRPAQDGHDGFPRRNATEPNMRIAAERAMRARGTHWVVVDEAHHIVQTHSPANARNYLDSLKSLGNTAGVVSVWAAGYPILDTGFASCHLNGRIRVVHFRRYRDTPDDRDEFCDAIATLSSELPFEAGKSLLDFWTSLHRHSYGCIGGVVTWTQAALVEMLIRGHATLQPEHFSATRYHLQQLGMEDEIARGEKLLGTISIRSDSSPPVPKAAKTQGKARRPFTRKPKRDPVPMRRKRGPGDRAAQSH